jgi:hypothetical protein
MEPSLRCRVRDGDPAAFGVLFDEHSRVVYSLAFRLTGSWQEAEEVVSLTFLEAWRLRARVEPDGESLRPWLIGVAVNRPDLVRAPVLGRRVAGAAITGRDTTDPRCPGPQPGIASGFGPLAARGAHQPRLVPALQQPRRARRRTRHHSLGHMRRSQFRGR